MVAGFDYGPTITADFVKISLHRPNEVTTREEIPTKMAMAAVAGIFKNALYVAGIGDDVDEIWKYSQTSGWMECASLVQCRRRHSAAFIDEILYICGGYTDSTERALDSVET